MLGGGSGPWERLGGKLVLIGAATFVAGIVQAFSGMIPLPWWPFVFAGLGLMAIGLLLLRRTLGRQSSRDDWQRALWFMPLRLADAWKPLLLPAVIGTVLGILWLIQSAGIRFPPAVFLLAVFFCVGATLTAVGGWGYLQDAVRSARDTSTPAFARPSRVVVVVLGGLAGAGLVLPTFILIPEMWSNAEPEPGWSGTVEEVWHGVGNETRTIDIAGGGPTFLLAGEPEGQGTTRAPAGAERVVVEVDDAQSHVTNIEARLDGRWTSLDVAGGNGPWTAEHAQLGGAEVRVTVARRVSQVDPAQVEAKFAFEEHLWCKHVSYEDGRRIDECGDVPPTMP